MLRALRATPPTERSPRAEPLPRLGSTSSAVPDEARSAPPRAEPPAPRPAPSRRLEPLGLAWLPRAVGAALLGLGFAGALGCGAALPVEAERPATVDLATPDRPAPDPARFRRVLGEVVRAESERPPERRVALAGLAGAKASANPAFFDARLSLREGLRPSAAIDDLLTGDGSAYTLTPAQLTAALTLGAKKRYYEELYGAELGALRFDLDFTYEVGPAVATFHLWRQTGSLVPPRAEEDWRGLLAPLSSLRMSLEPSHRPGVLVAHDELVDDRASPEARRLGLDRLPVIDLGTIDGAQMVWSHPRGVEPLTALVEARTAPGQRIEAPTELRRHFGGGAIEAASSYDRQVVLPRLGPDTGWRNPRVADIDLSHAVLARLVDAVEPAKLEVAIAFFRSGAAVTQVGDAELLLSALGSRGVFSLAQAFDEALPEARKATLLAGIEAPEPRDKARVALFVTFGRGASSDPYRWPTQVALEQRKELDALAELQPGGGLGGPREFADFVASPRFRALWRTRTGQDYAGPTEVVRLTTAEVQAIVEVLLPSARHLDRRGEHVHRPQVVAPRLSGLLAELLSGRTAEPRLVPRHHQAEAPGG